MELNERIKHLRTQLNLTQSEFAGALGLTHSIISTTESGKTPLTESNIKLLCKTFKVREEWLRDGTGDMYDSAATRSDMENRLLEAYRKLSPSAKKMAFEIIEVVRQNNTEK